MINEPLSFLTKFEPKEVVNMLASAGFFVYFYVLVRNGRYKLIPEIWLYGIFLITISNTASVMEGFGFFHLFNFIEHASFTCACSFFLFGAIILKPNAHA